MGKIKKIIFLILILIALGSIPFLIIEPEDGIEGVLSHARQIAAALAIFAVVVATSGWLGVIFVRWGSEFIVDFIYGAHGSSVEDKKNRSLQLPEKD